jgi:hypothetical protein
MRLTYDRVLNLALELSETVLERKYCIEVEHLRLKIGNESLRIEGLDGLLLGRATDLDGARSLLLHHLAPKKMTAFVK